MRKLLVLALSIVLPALNLLGNDLAITSRVTTKGGKEGVQVQYISPTRMRLNNGTLKVDSLVDYGKEVIYTIDHAKRTITKVTFKDMQETLQSMEGQMNGMPEMVMKMMFGDVSNTKVEQLGADTVLGRPCRKVRITVGKMVEELSLDPSLQFPIRDYAKAMSFANRMPGQMGVLFKKLYQEVGRLKGVPLRTRVTGVMGMDSLTEATAVSTAALPEGTWALPAGYTMKDGGKEMKETMRGRH